MTPENHEASSLMWIQIFCATLTGVVGAQRTLPNPEAMIEWCAHVADLGVQEALKRR